MERAGDGALRKMQQYPTLLALYAIGLGSVAADRLEPIAHALGTIKVQDQNRARPVGVSASSWTVLHDPLVRKSISGLEDHKTLVSDHLLDALRPAVSEIIREERLEDLFDEVEYLMGLACASDYGEGPVGRTAWRSWSTDRHPGTMIERHEELLVTEGVFQSVEQLAETRMAYNNTVVRRGMGI